MRHMRRDGDLSFATSRPSIQVRCVLPPDISFWELLAPLQNFELPEVDKIYVVRANVLLPEGFIGPYRSGVLLNRIRNPEVHCGGQWSTEPFFSFRCFNAIAQPQALPARIANRQGRR